MTNIKQDMEISDDLLFLGHEVQEFIEEFRAHGYSDNDITAALMGQALGVEFLNGIPRQDIHIVVDVIYDNLTETVKTISH